MATSSKVQFSLSKLREKALQSIDYRIQQKELEVASYDSDEALTERITEWRARQEEKLSDLFQQLDTVDNHKLSLFKLDSIPKVDLYDRSRAGRELERLRSKRSQIAAKSESLVGDENGNISLTKTQLEEFFGL